MIGIGFFELLILATVLLIGVGALAAIVFAAFFAAKAGSRSERHEQEARARSDD